MAIDLTWTTAAEPYHYGVTTRYEVSCTVAGTIRVGGEALTIDGHRPAGPLLGRARLVGLRVVLVGGHASPTARAFHLADIRLPGRRSGSATRSPGGWTRPAAAVLADEDVDGDGLPRPGASGRRCPASTSHSRPSPSPRCVFVADDGRMTRFPRALCRYRRRDGAEGWGWTEWNQPT